MITKQQLENAALAMGFPEPHTYLDGSGLLWYERLGLVWWKPLDPTSEYDLYKLCFGYRNASTKDADGWWLAIKNLCGIK
jgi:hypothetical protein